MAATNAVAAAAVGSGSSGIVTMAAAARETKSLPIAMTRDMVTMARRSPAEEQGKCSVAASGGACTPGMAASPARTRLIAASNTIKWTMRFMEDGAYSGIASASVCVARFYDRVRLVCISLVLGSIFRTRAGEYRISRGRIVSEEEYPSSVGVATGVSPRRVAASISKRVELQCPEQIFWPQ